MLSAIARGAYPVLIFSGHREVLGEISGELSSLATTKFVMVDPTLSADGDFASSSGSTLPSWPSDSLRPMRGVLFLFTEASHPAVSRLHNLGAEAGHDFHVFAQSALSNDRSAFSSKLQAFAASIPEHGDILILGYGHQGRLIVDALRNARRIDPARIIVHDSSPQSAAVARMNGYRICDELPELSRLAAVISSPLARHERLASALERAKETGVAAFDNARAASGLQHWTRRGRVFLDEAASKSLTVEPDDRTISCRDELMRSLLTAHIVRQDRRILGGACGPHLLSGQRHAFRHEPTIDTSQRWDSDGLASATFGSFDRTFISLRGRADLGFFAAREMCADIWPATTASVFPSQHAVDLGQNGFERALKAHLDAREIVTTMQTPAQRVVLGVAAAHHASNRPIIEIGSAYGGSALLMAHATERCAEPIISIDPDAPTRDIMRFAFEREGHGNRLRQIVLTSDDAVARLADFHQRCGLVFIDGLHTAVAVLRDFRNYAPMVAVGGALAFHDVCPAIHSVMQTVVAHVLSDRRFQARCLVDGLLILERVAADP